MGDPHVCAQNKKKPYIFIAYFRAFIPILGNSQRLDIYIYSKVLDNFENVFHF